MACSPSAVVRGQRPLAPLDSIVRNIADSMVGRAVDLLVGREKTAHGIVSAVQFVAGTPKIVVEGTQYRLDQVLTSVPASLN